MRDSAARTSVRLDSLTGLRWWAAFAVFLFHMRVFAPLPHASDLVAFGNFGVTFFFILSGFVLTWSARPQTKPTTFWWRRFARIYPAHIVALLLAVPVFYSFSPEPSDWWVKPVSVAILLLSVFLLQGWSTSPEILFSGNPAAWTLTCEAFFYALHPALHRGFLRLTRRGALWATFAVILLALVYRLATLAFPTAWFALLPLPVVRLTEFVIGIGIARAMLLGWRPKMPVWGCYLLGAGFLVWFVLALRFDFSDIVSVAALRIANEIVIVVFALTISAVAARDLAGRRSMLQHPVLVKLGEWSFCFYLIHATVMYIFLDVFGTQTAAWINLGWHALVFLVAALGAWLMHAALERPVESRMRRWWDEKQANGHESSPARG